jgi:hypothetical protein
MDKTYFLLTAYTGGSFVNEKKNHTLKYIKQLRKYFPNSYIVLIDSVNDKDICDACDLYVCELLNNNEPHGQGDLDKIKIGLNLLEGIGAEYVIRSAYDYWMDDIIFEQSKQWIKLLKEGKKIIGSQWGDINFNLTFSKSISTGFGCYNVKAAKQLFNIDTVQPEPTFEEQIYSQLVKYFQPNEYHIYPSCPEMFNSGIYDIFNYSGTVLNYKRLNSIL